ncbi:MAG: hypothetical protein NVV82_26900 [Sporocytophaga sp.]|nr:hypothetical protein [Sporocytophaga sp.]
MEELKISENEFILYHHSHVDGTYMRNGMVEQSGDTIKLIEKSNTIKSSDSLFPFNSKFVFKNNHLFVVFKNKIGKDFVKNSPWNYSKTSNNFDTNKPDWYSE